VEQGGSAGVVLVIMSVSGKFVLAELRDSEQRHCDREQLSMDSNGRINPCNAILLMTQRTVP
jgi:hypothetical protein